MSPPSFPRRQRLTLLATSVGLFMSFLDATIVNVAPSDIQRDFNAGIWTGVASVGLALGPTVGGFLTESLGWRSIFLVNVVIGLIGVLMVMAFVDESRDPTARSLDVLGQVLFIVAVGGLTYALIEGPHQGWGSPLIVGLLVSAAAVGTAFVVAELHSNDPMMDVRVFGDRVYSVAIFSLFAVMFSVYGLLLVIALIAGFLIFPRGTRDEGAATAS